MKKVFLDNLPRYKEGRYKNKINWKKSVGHKVKFIYNNIEDEVEIIKYYNKNKEYYLNIKYKNDIISINVGNFTKCSLGEILKIKTNIYKYNINDIIKTKTGEIKILEQIRILRKIDTVKSYKYLCLIDGNIDIITEYNLQNGKGCNTCYGKKILIGYNDLWTTHPYIAKYLKYPERGYKITYGSGESEIFVCPDCGYEKEYRINYMHNGFSCPRCGDGLSYPNKFTFNLLEQLLSNNFISEYNPDWIKPKKYDFYFELNNIKYILEMDGRLGHGRYNPLSGQTAEESQAIDDYKNIMAEENGIEVIRIDCEKSDLDYIKENILHSRLNELFDLSNINWLKCHEYACSSLVKIACDLWNSGIISTTDISNIMKLSKNTIRNYLKQGVKLGWCDYDPKLAFKNNGGKNKKSIIQLSLRNEYISEYDSITEIKKQLNINIGNISDCCKNKRNTSYGFKWIYKEDYEKYIEDQNKIA